MSEKRRVIRIESDGTQFGCRVMDDATGELIGGVRYVRFEQNAGELPVLTLEMIDPVIRAVGTVYSRPEERRQCILCGAPYDPGDPPIPHACPGSVPR